MFQCQLSTALADGDFQSRDKMQGQEPHITHNGWHAQPVIDKSHCHFLSESTILQSSSEGMSSLGRPWTQEPFDVSPLVFPPPFLCTSSGGYSQSGYRAGKPLFLQIKGPWEPDTFLHVSNFMECCVCIFLSYHIVSTSGEDNMFFPSFCLSPTCSIATPTTPASYSIKIHCMLH